MYSLIFLYQLNYFACLTQTLNVNFFLPTCNHMILCSQKSHTPDLWRKRLYLLYYIYIVKHIYTLLWPPFILTVFYCTFHEHITYTYLRPVCDVRLQYNSNHVVSKSHEGELTFTSQRRPAVKFKQEKTHAHEINCTRTILPNEKKKIQTKSNYVYV